MNMHFYVLEFIYITKSCSIYLQAIGKSFKSMFISVMRDVVLFIPSLIILAKLYGITGMLWAALIADIIAFIIAIFMVKEKKSNIVVNEIVSKNIIKDEKVLPEKIVITISREYGSGGRYVGKLLADYLNIPCYDKEIIIETAKKSGLSDEYVKQFEQTKKDFSIYYNNDDNIFLNESKVIKNMANCSCVIIGRCADFILKDKENIYKIFLYSDMDNKINRVVNYYGTNKSDARKEINLINKNRAKHYEYYTGQKWNDINNYDLAINVDKLGVVKTADAIKNILNNKN